MIKDIFPLQGSASRRKSQGIKKHDVLPALLGSKSDKATDLSVS